ncbi:MAG: ABC transporter ATP-binding protein [Phycisphaerae bacterium]
MAEPIIDIDSISKKYMVAPVRKELPLGRRVLGQLVEPFRRLRQFGQSSYRDQDAIWALKDVSLQVAPGEVVGIIGRNGSGKSTLLKILSRITPPTEGMAVLRGRVGSLLEVGTGFNPQLTGRENVFLSGAILGMSQAEARSRFDEIVSFAGVQRYIDTPVKRYSSGMCVRLGFAVAAHLDSDILLIDEVLAVGDAGFKKRCLGKMSEVGRSGRTILFVSHNMASIRSLCDRVVWLRDGQIAAIGEPEPIVDAYLQEETAPESPQEGVREWPAESAPGGAGGELRLLRVSALDGGGNTKSTFTTDETIRVQCEYEQMVPLCGLRLAVQVVTNNGEVAFTSTDHYLRGLKDFPPGRYASTCEIPGELMNRGEYCVRVWAGIPDVRYLVRPVEAIRFQVTGVGNQGSDFEDKYAWPGVVCPRLQWTLNENAEVQHGVS